eukprot:Tbor_TRINITY_DN4783_c0_g1::TRINITY_DN4783_c0_g1_i1::g.17186::m.17186
MSEIPEAAAGVTINGLSSLVKTLITIVQKEAVDPSIVDPTIIQQRNMHAAMTFLSGDWSILDKCRLEISKVLTNVTQNGTQTQSFVSHSANAAYEALSDDEQIRQLVKSFCLASTDPIGHTKDTLESALTQLLKTWMTASVADDGTSEKFSDVIKKCVMQSTGKWYNGLVITLSQGKDGLQPLMQQLSQIASQKFIANFPEVSPMISMFAFPMIINMLNKFYEQYLEQNQ